MGYRDIHNYSGGFKIFVHMIYVMKQKLLKRVFKKSWLKKSLDATKRLHDCLEKSAAPEEVKMLIEAGADMSMDDNYGRGLTALDLAARNNKNPEVIRILIEAGSGLLARGRYGMSPLMYAAESNENPEILRVLIEAGSDVNEKSRFGFTPLMYAAYSNKNPEVLNALIKAGADVNGKSSD